MGKLKGFGDAIQAVILDLDGTMVNSFPDLVSAANQVRLGLGMPKLSYDEVIAHVGYGPEVLIRGILPGIDEHDVQSRVGHFIDVYTKLQDKNAVVFPGVREFLQGSGLRHAVLTNKMERLARAVLQRFDLARYIEKVCGYDTIGYCKPDGRALAWLLGAMGLMPSQAIYIGDSDIDMKTALAADVPFVLVDTGLIGTLGNDLPENRVARLDELLA